MVFEEEGWVEGGRWTEAGGGWIGGGWGLSM